MTVVRMMQILYHKTIAYISLGEAGTELFGFLEAAVWFWTTGESAEKKVEGRGERLRDDCLCWICMLGKGLTKFLYLRELIN